LPAKKLVEQPDRHGPAIPALAIRPQDGLGARSSEARAGRLDADLWHDVFVQQKLPWSRFLQSALLHSAAFGLIWVISIAWLRQQKILGPIPFDRSSVITYSREDYLPALDTGPAAPPKTQSGDPAFAKQPILSVPREADNRSQTIVVPPDVKLDHDVPLPNIIATGAITPTVPLDATRSLSNRTPTPDPQVIAPAPDADFTRGATNRAALRSDVVPPPPEMKQDRARGVSGPETAVIEPPPEVTTSAKGRLGALNVGPSQVVAPAPQLTVAEQHTPRHGGSGTSGLSGGEVVGPPPSIAASGGSGNQGRIIALNLHPSAPAGPVTVPGGNRRGMFAANPKGKAGGSGTPDVTGSSAANGSGAFKNHGNGSLPAGLHVGAGPGATGSVERDGGSSDGEGGGAGASVSPSASVSSKRQRAESVADDKITDLDRQVFGDRRLYAMTLNMPNLNSSTGSWVIRFAELRPGAKQGTLLAPVPTEKSDPGYPLELMRSNVHGMVTLHAVIHSDGHVGDIRVLNSPDDRLDGWAADALARWKFVPAERNGKPIAVEALVVIPFHTRRSF